MLNHNYIGTEHILLGLIHEGEGVAAKALESLGISLQTVRQQVEEIIGQGQQAPSGNIPFTPRVKKVLELALREAQQLGHNYIGTEHILLGLIREGQGVAAQVLVKLGADLSRARQQVIQLLHGYQRGEPAAASRQSPGRAGREDRELLSRLVDQVTAMESRLSAIEHRAGTGPEVSRNSTSRSIRPAATGKPPSTLRTTRMRRRCGTGNGSWPRRRPPASRNGPPRTWTFPLWPRRFIGSAVRSKVFVPFAASRTPDRRTAQHNQPPVCEGSQGLRQPGCPVSSLPTAAGPHDPGA